MCNKLDMSEHPPAVNADSFRQIDEVELTVLLPCLDEMETIEICIDKAMSFLARSGVSGEVLVADNGSVDGSQQLAAAKGARVVSVGERGYGSALRHGIQAARGRYIVMGDADDSYDLSGSGTLRSKTSRWVRCCYGQSIPRRDRCRCNAIPPSLPRQPGA